MHAAILDSDADTDVAQANKLDRRTAAYVLAIQEVGRAFS
jgi:hypothetical protein